MRIFIMMLALLALMLVPVMAETPEATTKRITNLENAIQVLREDLANTKLELDTTKEKLQKNIDAEAQSRKDLDAKVNKLQDALTAEIAARGASDKMIAELQAELQTAKAREDVMQANFDQTKKEQAAAMASLASLIEKNYKQDKKDRTINYAIEAILGGIAIFKK